MKISCRSRRLSRFVFLCFLAPFRKSSIDKSWDTISIRFILHTAILNLRKNVAESHIHYFVTGITDEAMESKPRDIVGLLHGKRLNYISS